jgi:hypothetical protein
MALTRLRMGPFDLTMCGADGVHRVEEEALEAFYRDQGLELPPREVEVQPISMQLPGSLPFDYAIPSSR